MQPHTSGIVNVPETVVPVPVEELSSVHIERLIFDTERQAAIAQAEYKDLCITAARADHAYKVAHAAALLDAEGPMELRKAAATLAASDELVAKEVAEATRDAQKELILAIRLRMDGLRTVSANIRTQT